MPKKHIEIIARGILIQNNHILLCQNVKHGHVFLPGGHVDFGEPARKALAREILEETGLRVRVDNFLGACEACFLQNGKKHHEINLVFKLTTRRALRKVSSREKALRFLLVPVLQLLAPNPTIKLLPPGIAHFLLLAAKTSPTPGRGEVPIFLSFPANSKR